MFDMKMKNWEIDQWDNSNNNTWNSRLEGGRGIEVIDSEIKL